MNKYLTIMVVPTKGKGIKTFRIPVIAYRTILLLSILFISLIAVLGYDYVNILRELYKNKHLSLENKQLKEQFQLFQIKINTLTHDLDRIKTLETKLKTITGLTYSLRDDLSPVTLPTQQELKDNLKKANPQNLAPDKPTSKKILSPTQGEYKQSDEYKEYKTLYEQKIAANFGLTTGYNYTKEWSALTQKSFKLADTFAHIDYLFEVNQKKSRNLEIQLALIDQKLLDRDSFLRSTPTLMPTRGWITSYYGPRISPYSGRLKMHEGLDLGATPGTPIYAPADGIVIYSGTKPGFGKTLSIDHGYGLETIYAHAKELKVKKGIHLARGDLIAEVGNTGYSTGPHLHYEIRINGIPVDPLYYILD